MMLSIFLCVCWQTCILFGTVVVQIFCPLNNFKILVCFMSSLDTLDMSSITHAICKYIFLVCSFLFLFSSSVIFTAIQHSKTRLQELADFFLGYSFWAFSSCYGDGKIENDVARLLAAYVKRGAFALFNCCDGVLLFLCLTHTHTRSWHPPSVSSSLRQTWSLREPTDPTSHFPN